MLIKKLFTSLLAGIWILYILLEIIVWQTSFRVGLFPNNAMLEIIANVLNDTLWIPLALTLPFYLSVIATKVTRFLSIKIGILLVGFVLFLAALFNLPVYFQYMIYLLVPFFAFVIYYIITFRKFRYNIIFFSLALLGMILNYQGQLIPTIDLGANPQPILKVMNYNILVSQYGRKRQNTINLIRHEKADVVFIQEINLLDRDLLRNELSDLYPHQLWSEKFETYNGGVILSRIPFISRQNYDIATEYMKGHMNLNHAVIQYQNQNVHLFNCHLYNSGGTFTGVLFGHLTPAQFKKRSETATLRHNAEVAMLAERILPIQEPVIFAGDFNDTPNSQTYRLFDERLQNAFAKAGWGLGATFGYRSLVNAVPKRLSFLVFDFLRIDHVFCSKHFKVHSAKVLPVDYSDHRPQTVKVQLKPLP